MFHPEASEKEVDMRHVGVVTRGIRTPIVRRGDSLVDIVVNSIDEAAQAEGFTIQDHDIVAVTESVLAKSQGNFVTIHDVSADIEEKYGKDATLGVLFPILSRNRFSLILNGIARGVKKVIIQLSYPHDEVGNPVVNPLEIFAKGINTTTQVFNDTAFRETFGYESTIHPFTGVDIVNYYHSINDNIEIIFANDPKEILNYTDNVLIASIHTRERDKELIQAAGGKKVYTLADVLSDRTEERGFNAEFGVLGSNASTDEILKLFPRDSQDFVDAVQRLFFQRFGKQVEVMVFGDGAFKDPVAGIWELADPVVSPAYTPGLAGTPNEYKLKYLVDDSGLSDEEIRKKLTNRNIEQAATLGTTPRRIPDLVGSLADLTSGSGDKGTPVVYIQGYFDNYADE